MVFDNKFGMFIHWGIYSTLGLHEQALARYELDKAEYEKLKDSFNPKDYDPEKWVLLAKAAGMKYICFTAKHHDGFCMWDTKYTDYNIMNTPYGKDVLKMLSEACEKHGMMLSIYYSNPDWHHENGYNPSSTHQWRAERGCEVNTEKYREYIKNQIRELLTGYGKIYTLFWDIPPRISDPSINELVRSLQPGILINDRGWDEGDFSTPEREYEKKTNARFSRMTEACNSLGVQSWAYRKDEEFYSIRHIISSIDRVMAMGGSYLLNVGPDENGVILPKYSERIEKIGDWYNRMGGCLEGADEDSFEYEIKNVEFVATQKNKKSYIHFYAGLISDSISFKKYPSMPKCVRLMNTGEPLEFKKCALPEFFSLSDGIAERDLLHISGIPIDKLEGEAVVLEIEW